MISSRCRRYPFKKALSNFAKISNVELKLTKGREGQTFEFFFIILHYLILSDTFSSTYICIYFLAVHLIIPGLNDSMVKLPTSIMLEISDALKAQLGKQGLFREQ